MAPVPNEKLYDIVSDLKYTAEKRYVEDFNIEKEQTPFSLYLTDDEKEAIKTSMREALQSVIEELKNERQTNT